VPFTLRYLTANGEGITRRNEELDSSFRWNDEQRSGSWIRFTATSRTKANSVFDYNALPVNGRKQGACHVIQQLLLSSALANAAKASHPNNASRKAIASFMSTRN
jgi:hypothetical protein